MLPGRHRGDATWQKRRVHDKVRNQAHHVLQLSRRRADEVCVIIDQARLDLLDDVKADEGEGETTPWWLCSLLVSTQGMRCCSSPACFAAGKNERNNAAALPRVPRCCRRI